MSQQPKSNTVLDLIVKRIVEIIEITDKLSDDNTKDTEKCDSLKQEIKTPGISKERERELMLELSTIASHMISKVNEIGINVRVVNELYALLVFEDYTDSIPEAYKEILEYNLKNVKPTFVLDKGEIKYYDPLLEEAINAKVAERFKEVKNED